MIIDDIIILIIIVLLVLVSFPLVRANESLNIIFNIVYLVLPLLYFARFESSASMATPGKMALGIVVTDAQGNRLTFMHALGRNAGKIVSNLTLFIGYIMAGFTQRKQALHDMIASCLVIKKEADLEQGLPPKTSSLPVWVVILVIIVLAPFFIGLVAAVALPQYVKAVEKSRAAEALSMMGSIAGSQERHRLTRGVYARGWSSLDIEFNGIVNANDIQTDNFLYKLGANSIVAERSGRFNWVLTKCYATGIICCYGGYDNPNAFCRNLGLDVVKSPQECCR